jgi:CheY-like chemotaxis protein
MRSPAMADQDSDSTRSPTILLVEDDPMVLDVTAELLADGGFAVRCAASAEEALAALREGPIPAVLVTDIGLAGGSSGLDLARAVARGWPAVKLLIVSGIERPPPADFPEGALFFTKPYAPGALLAMVRAPDW